MLAILSFLLQLPLIKVGAALLGITTEPNIVWRGVRDAPDDKRVPYQTWYHLEGINAQRGGWRGRLAATHDADQCHATMEFRPSSGDGEVRSDDALITLGATSAAIAPLFVDKPFWIPVYWIGDAKHRQHPRGTSVLPGYYISGATWWDHSNLWFQWRLTPGIYQVTVSLVWNRKEFPYKFELAVPPVEGD